MSAPGPTFSPLDEPWMRRALALASKGCGATSPNPMVGAVLVRGGQLLGEGWHRRAGEPHAEINALASARRRGFDPRGATLYVTLEPCSTSGRTPPCTSALIESGLARVIAGARDPNPRHRGAGFRILRRHGIPAAHGLLARECEQLNEAFNHWIVHRRPFVILKSAMSLDGKIASNSGESRWITSPPARAFGMRLRAGADAILCGINTILRDDPALTLRPARGVKIPPGKTLRRIVLDREARTPPGARILAGGPPFAATIVVSPDAPARRVRALAKRGQILPLRLVRGAFDLDALLNQLGAAQITSLLVEGGGETHAHFLERRLASRVYFFYAPLIISGRSAPKSVGGARTLNHGAGFRLSAPEWRPLGPDLLLTGLVRY